MTEEVLKAIHAKTNAIDAVNTALQAEWQIIEELDELVSKDRDTADFTSIREKVAELKALNSALPAAVVANVTPASAGPVGKSMKEQVIEQADGVVAESLAAVAAASKDAQVIAEHLRTVFENLHQAGSAIAGAKAVE